MCVQYWPASKGKVEVYDDITVTYTHEEQLANFVIRNFKIIKDGPVSCSLSTAFLIINNCVSSFFCIVKKGKQERLLLQFHYTEWHSHTCVIN